MLSHFEILKWNFISIFEGKIINKPDINQHFKFIAMPNRLALDSPNGEQKLDIIFISFGFCFWIL